MQAPPPDRPQVADQAQQVAQCHSGSGGALLRRAALQVAEGGGGHSAGGSHLSLTASLSTGQSGPGGDDLPEACGHIEGITDGFFIGLACTGKGKQHRR